MLWLRINLVLLSLLGATSVVAYSKCLSVRQVDFKNHSYPLKESGFTQGRERLRVTKGRYEEPHENPSSVSFLYFQVVDVVFGDLTGDGKEEAAVVVNYGSNSGNFYLTDTYVFGCVAGQVKLIEILKQSRIRNEYSFPIYESTQKPVTIRNGSLLVTYYTDGGHASPEFVTTFRYKMVRGTLVQGGILMKRRINN